jgi:hypothetical protein
MQSKRHESLLAVIHARTLKRTHEQELFLRRKDSGNNRQWMACIKPSRRLVMGRMH